MIETVSTEQENQELYLNYYKMNPKALTPGQSHLNLEFRGFVRPNKH